MMKQTFRHIALAAAVTAATLGISAQELAAYPDSAQRRVDRFAAQSFFKHASVGVAVLDMATGKLVAGANADQAQITASTMKSLTSATAMEVLGKDFRFHTKVKAIGSVVDGELQGNLVVVGGGDPTLGSSHFPDHPSFVEAVATAVANLGIKSIKGTIKVDESAYVGSPVSQYWMVEDISAYYGPGIHALNYRDNTVVVSATHNGASLSNVNVSPDVDLDVESNLQVGSSNDILYFIDYGNKPKLVLMGSTTKGTGKISEVVVNPNPAALLISELKQTLSKRGITVGKSSASSDGNVSQVLDFQSPRLEEIVVSALKRSDNMFTEGLLRGVAAKQGEDVSFKSGTEAVNKYWKGRGVDVDGLFMRDGSGLARNNKASARFFTEMLRKAEGDSTRMGVQFSKLLTRLGDNANAGKIIKTVPELKGRIASKSGSMSDVQCYVGYYPYENPRYTWAILANNYTCARAKLKEQIDRLLIDLFMPSKTEDKGQIE